MGLTDWLTHSLTPSGGLCFCVSSAYASSVESARTEILCWQTFCLLQQNCFCYASTVDVVVVGRGTTKFCLRLCRARRIIKCIARGGGRKYHKDSVRGDWFSCFISRKHPTSDITRDILSLVTSCSSFAGSVLGSLLYVCTYVLAHPIERKNWTDTESKQMTTEKVCPFEAVIKVTPWLRLCRCTVSAAVYSKSTTLHCCGRHILSCRQL